MSVFLKPEEMFDRPLGGTSTDPQVPHWCGNILYVLTGIVCKIIGRYKVINRKTLRDFNGKEGVVIACNHTSFLDIPFLYCAVRPSQWIRFMARDSLFHNKLAGQIMGRVGAFPVKRDSADMTSVKRAARMLKNGEVVGIFPEGTRRGRGTKEPDIHGGAALVARMGKAAILPTAITGADRIKVKGKPFIRFPKVVLEFGKPVHVSDFDFLPKEQRLDGCVWYVMRESYAMAQKVEPEQVDMVSLFPTSYDFSVLFAEHGRI